MQTHLCLFPKTLPNIELSPNFGRIVAAENLIQYFGCKKNLFPFSPNTQLSLRKKFRIFLSQIPDCRAFFKSVSEFRISLWRIFHCSNASGIGSAWSQCVTKNKFFSRDVWFFRINFEVFSVPETPNICNFLLISPKISPVEKKDHRWLTLLPDFNMRPTLRPAPRAYAVVAPWSARSCIMFSPHIPLTLGSGAVRSVNWYHTVHVEPAGGLHGFAQRIITARSAMHNTRRLHATASTFFRMPRQSSTRRH